VPSGNEAVTATDLGGTRVLIVDDDSSNRVLLVRLLRRAGITRVREETDGAAVPGAVAAFDPHLVLLDLHLGGAVNGFEALETLAKLDPRFAQRAVLVLTGDVGDHVTQRAAVLGARGVFTKPYNPVEFLATVEGLLRSTDVGGMTDDQTKPQSTRTDPPTETGPRA
jgi:CheY-like chemotaxis protein